MPDPASSKPPDSILVIGAGAFGLSTLRALLSSPRYKATRFTLIAPFAPVSRSADGEAGQSASQDQSRIIRSDYADAGYARLAARAHSVWRTGSDTGEGPRWGEWYRESGLVVSCTFPEGGEGNSAGGEEGDWGAGERNGEGYVRQSLENVRALRKAQGDGWGSRECEELFSTAEVAEASGLEAGGSSERGSAYGYMNPTAGWADAAAALAGVYEEIETTGRVEHVTSTVTRLVWSRDEGTAVTTITGAETVAHGIVKADLTILAAGAHTGSLIDLRGRVSASAQQLAYFDLSDGEYERLAGVRVSLDWSTGWFVVPPHPKTRQLKVARHGWGWHCLREVDEDGGWLRFDEKKESGGRVTTSLPPAISGSASGAPSTIPESALSELKAYLHRTIPWLSEREPSSTRLCWYADSPAAEFLIARPPCTNGLVVATGDSGHGFKFLPVLGNVVVSAVIEEGQGEEDVVWRRKWGWGEGKVGEGLYEEVWAEDGARGGVKGEFLVSDGRGNWRIEGEGKKG